MIDGLQPYPAYKKSGVAWLGEVPAHWETSRLKTVVANIVEQTAVRRDKELYIALENVEGWTGRIRQSGSDTAFDSQVKRFRANDVLFGKLRPYLAKVARPSHDGVCVGEFLVLRPRHASLSARYLEHLLRSKPIIDAVNSSTFGARMPRADWQFIGSMEIAVPPLREQEAVACFLDYINRRIRRYICAKRRLITLLEEQKQAIIYRTVTRGLDPKVRLKASGLDWLGEIPESWAVRRNGQLFAQRNEVGFSELPILEVSLRTGVRIREFDGTVRKQVMADRGKYKRAVQGDVVYNMMRMWQGAVGVARVDGLVSPAYVVARPVPGVDVRYFTNLFRTATYMRQVDGRSRGIVKDRNRLYWEDFRQLASPYPAPAEQREIANAIEARTQHTTAAVERLGREISLVGEYRVRLISDVVTGMLDVRAVAETLSREADELEVNDDDVFDEIDALAERDESANEDLAFLSQEAGA